MPIATSTIFREPDGQYTTVSQHGLQGDAGDLIVNPVSNQTLANAFNQGRDDLAGVLTGGKVARRIVISLEYV